MELPARFWSKVDKNGPDWQGTPCWLWTGGLYVNGYGRFGYKGRYYRAHRFLYEALVAPVAKGLEMDHLCRRRACVNPSHLEPVTRSINARRGLNAQTLKTQCPAGHPYSQENTIVLRRGDGAYRKCRICHRRGMRKKPDGAITA